MAEVLNVQLGVCDIKINGVSVGHTIGGAELIYSPEYHETKVDKYTGVVERYLIGEKFGVKANLAESVLSVLQHAIPFATEDGSKLTIGSYSGKRLSEKAKEIVLHPIANAEGDRSDDVVIYKGAATNEVVLPYKNDGERVFETMLEAFADEDRADGNMLGMIGDSTS